METKYYLEVFPGNYAALAQVCSAAVAESKAVVEKTRDLLGGIRVCTLGYEKRLKLGPWYASEGDGVYNHLRMILEKGLVMDSLRSALVEVTGESALRREAFLEITGAKEGSVAFCLHFTGKEQKGTFREGRFAR